MDLKLEIFKEVKPRGSSRALLMPDGKLYFTKTAIELFGLDKGVHVNIAQNSNDPQDQNIYLLKSSPNDDYALKITKSGYLNSQNYFQDKGIDAKAHPYFYHIKKEKYEDKNILVLLFQGERKRRGAQKKE